MIALIKKIVILIVRVIFMSRRKWTEMETILAMDLYTRIPRSKITEKNEYVIELAKIIDRTTGAVALKMHNLSHFDPSLQMRNLSGMSHTSKLDKIIYEKFAENIEELSFSAQQIKVRLLHTPVERLLPDLKLDSIPIGMNKERQVKTRVGQYFFRKSVLAAYGNSCCVTKLKNEELLVASHIKPWNVSNDENEKTNPSNGLCLNSLHDKAFDRGLITIDDNYRIVNSRYIYDTEMDDETRGWFDFYNGKEITLPDKFRPKKEFIEYHNDVIFQG